MANHPPKDKDKEKGKHDAHDAEAPAKKKGLGLMFFVFCGLAVAGGGMFPLGYDLVYPPAPVGDHAEDHEGSPHTDLPEPTESTFIPFGEVVANLNDTELARFLRMKILLEVNSEYSSQVSALLPEQQAPLKNWMLGMIADKRLEEVQGGVNQARLRREIRDRFNAYLNMDGAEPVIDVLFEEFNIQ